MRTVTTARILSHLEKRMNWFWIFWHWEDKGNLYDTFPKKESTVLSNCSNRERENDPIIWQHALVLYPGLVFRVLTCSTMLLKASLLVWSISRASKRWRITRSNSSHISVCPKSSAGAIWMENWTIDPIQPCVTHVSRVSAIIEKHPSWFKLLPYIFNLHTGFPSNSVQNHLTAKKYK